MKSSVERKGYSKRVDIPTVLLNRLSAGKEESKTLAEITAIDMKILISRNFPSIRAKNLSFFEGNAGILKKMKHAAQMVSDEHGYKHHKTLLARDSCDTLRGIGAFMVGLNPKLTPMQKVKAVTPFAKDPHFGVREWAWMAIRDQIVDDFDSFYECILPMSKTKDEYTKRFSVESIRPRGVWAAHIKELKDDPSKAVELIDNLFYDESKYINDSVGNWLNDAAKDHPKWVAKKCKEALRLAERDSKALQYTVTRATRSIKR